MSLTRWLSVAAALIAGLLGVALHWHVSLFGTTNVYAAKSMPKPAPHYQTMTAARCKAIGYRDTEAHVKALYGPDESVVASSGDGPAGMLVDGDSSPNALYDIGASQGCWVFFNAGRVYQVWEQLR